MDDKKIAELFKDVIITEANNSISNKKIAQIHMGNVKSISKKAKILEYTLLYSQLKKIIEPSLVESDFIVSKEKSKEEISNREKNRIKNAINRMSYDLNRINDYMIYMKEQLKDIEDGMGVL